MDSIEQPLIVAVVSTFRDTQVIKQVAIRTHRYVVTVLKGYCRKLTVTRLLKCM